MASDLLFGKVPPLPLLPEYGYAHASLCLLDAIYSINPRYESVNTKESKGIIWNYCRFFGLDPYEISPTGEDTLSNLRGRLTTTGPEPFAANVLDNRSRVNIGGARRLLKCEIVAQVCDWLMRAHGVDGINTLQDWANRSDPEQVEYALKSEGIGGIGATTVKYLMMIAGNDAQIKPDRRIIAFVADIVHHPVNADEASEALQQEAERVGKTPREIDYSVWVYQRARSRRQNAKN